MPTAATAEEKKFEPLPKNGWEFNEKVTLKRWNPDQKVFINSTDNINAIRYSVKDGMKRFTLKGKDIGASAIAKGSEVVDADQNVYVVEAVDNVGPDKSVRIIKKP